MTLGVVAEEERRKAVVKGGERLAVAVKGCVAFQWTPVLSLCRTAVMRDVSIKAIEPIFSGRSLPGRQRRRVRSPVCP